MKKYRFGDILLAARAEYLECEQLLDELNQLIDIDDSVKRHHIEGSLRSKDEMVKEARLHLVVEREKSKIKEKMLRLKPFWDKERFYEAYYDIINKDDQVSLEYINRWPYKDDIGRYKPDVKIAHQEPFKYKLNELNKKEIMHTPKGFFGVNYDTILLNLGQVEINSPIGIETKIVWNGKKDEIKYKTRKDYTPELLADVLQLEIREDEMSPKWVEIMKKHRDIVEERPCFEVDIRTDRKGKLKIKRDYRVCKLIEE